MRALLRDSRDSPSPCARSPCSCRSAPFDDVMSIPFTIDVGKKKVDVIVDPAVRELFPKSCFVLGHGASGDANSGNLPAIAKYLSEAGVTVLRYTCHGQLPARVKGILDSKQGALSSVTHWILSGHSMGGRTACAVAKETQDVCAVVLYSYPLHPPAKPAAEIQELRDADLVELGIPVLIVRGTKDPFSREAVFNQVKCRMNSSKLEVVTVDGGDHSLGTKSKVGMDRFKEWAGATVQFVEAVLSALEPGVDAQPQKAERIPQKAEEAREGPKQQTGVKAGRQTGKRKHESSEGAAETQGKGNVRRKKAAT